MSADGETDGSDSLGIYCRIVHIFGRTNLKPKRRDLLTNLLFCTSLSCGRRWDDTDVVSDDWPADGILIIIIIESMVAFYID